MKISSPRDDCDDATYEGFKMGVRLLSSILHARRMSNERNVFESPQS